MRWQRHGIFLTLLILGFQANARVVYVDSSATLGANNGTSWANAYVSLVTAITASLANDTLWVARATYYPGPSGSNASSFFLKKNTVVLGGFQGLTGAQETSAAQRDYIANICILSGDLDQSGTFNSPDAYHVVDLLGEDTTAVLDGFTITGGNAVGPGANNRGAGIFSLNPPSGGRIRNCLIQNNFASNFGAAVYGSSTNLYLTNCIIRNNTMGPTGQGGGLYFAGTSFIRVINTVIANNIAGSLGGGGLLGSANCQFIHCTFAYNSAGTGGAIYGSSSSILFKNTIFWGNTPAAQIAGTNPIVDHCLVQGGFAAGTNIVTGDPNFKDSDYRIFACSPAVDAGDSLLPYFTDLDSNPRPFDGDGDLIAKWDIGAFENQVLATTPALNAITGPNPSCAKGDNVIYQVTTNNFPANTYVWTLPGGGGVVDGRADSNAVAIDWGTSTGNFTIQVTEIDGASGCSTTNTLSVNLTAPPVVTMSPTGSSSICDGDSLLLTASGTGVGFQWYRNGVLIPGATGTQYYAKQGGIHNVVLTNSSGCRDSAANAFNLVINPLPNVTFTPSGTAEICVDDLLTITGIAGSTFQWFRNGQALPGQNSQSILTSTAGLYNLLVTDGNGCTDSASTGVTVVVHPKPVVSITPPGIDTLCAGDNLPLTANAAGDTAWQWYLNGSLIPGATSNPFPGSMSGIYNVILTDSNGCQDSSATGREILIGDFVNPQSACHDTLIYLGAGGNASLTPAMVDNGSTDNCVVDSFALGQSLFVCSDSGTTAVTLTVFDAEQNSDFCVAQVTVLDTTSPIAVCMDNTGYLDGSGNLAVTSALIDGGSSDNCGIASALVSTTSYTCADTGVYVVTLTLTDVSGSMSSCTANLTVADSTRPDAACQNTAVFLDGSGNASISLANVENGSSDNCGIATSFLDRTTFTCADVPGVFVTMTVVDVSGNAGTCQAYVRVQDSVPPVALCQDTIIYIDPSGQAVLVPGDVDGGSSDNCAIDLASLSQTVFTCVDTGLNMVTLFIQDADTNISTCISNITVLDTIPPVAICSDTTFYLDSTGNAVVDPAIFGINSYDNCLFFDSAYVNVGPFTCADTGSYVVTLVVRDVNGRIDSCMGNVTIADTTAPFVMCRDTSIILDINGLASVTTPSLDLGTVDNCALDTVFLDQYNFDCSDVGLNNVTLTALDVYGNMRQCISAVTILDTVAPVAACRDTILYLNASGNAGITASDLDYGSTDNCIVDTLIASQLQFACQDTGVNAITLNVLDADANLASCISLVTVLDTIDPVAVCANITLNLDSQGAASLLASQVDGGSSDNCPIDTMILSANAFTCSDTGLNAITLTVQDPSGNTAVCTANVTVQDNAAPVVACINPTLYLDSLGNLTATVNDLAPGASDNCGFASTSLSQSVFDCQDVGMTFVGATFTDPSGNTSNCSSSVTVQDTIHPTALCGDTAIYLNGVGLAFLPVNMVDSGSFDACGIVSRIISQSAFNCSHVGLNAITLTVTDANGNGSSCISMVNVRDTIYPVASCRQDTIYLDNNGTGTVDPANLDNGSSDYCGIDTSYTSITTVNCSNFGLAPVTLTVSDPAGNLDSCTTSVLVLDSTAPLAVCDSVRLQLNASGYALLSQALMGPNSSDNCGITQNSIVPDSFTCADLGFQTSTLFLADQANNQSSCVSVVEVVDTSGIAAVNVNLGSDTTVCNGDTLVLNAGGGMASYLWSNNAVTQSIATTVAGTYSVTVTDSFGCLGLDTIQLTTRTIPEPNLRTESGEVVICQNDSLLLIVDAIYSTYLWSTGSTSPTTMVYTGGTYSVQLTDTGGCTLLRSISIQFVPFPAPNPNISPPSPAYYCQGNLLDLDAGPGYFAYRWNTNQTTQVITAFQPGTYQVQVWNGFGCHSYSSPVTVTELSSPQVTIQQNGDTLSTTAIGTYQWALNGNPIPGATQQFYVPTSTGDYSLLVVYTNGCFRTSNVLSVLVSVEPMSEILRGLQVFPNPSSGEIFLASVQPIRERVEVRVTDLFGRELITDEFRSLTSQRKVDLSKLPSGIYLLEVKASDGRSLHKIVLE